MKHSLYAQNQTRNYFAVYIHCTVPLVHIRIFEKINGHIPSIVHLSPLGSKDTTYPNINRSELFQNGISECEHLQKGRRRRNRTCSFTQTSTTQATTGTPSSSSSFLQRSISASFREQIPKRQPSLAKAFAIPLPIPRDAPVIQATRPFNEIIASKIKQTKY